MQRRLLSLALALPLISFAEPAKTAEERLRAELKEVQQMREALGQRERAIAARIKQLQAGQDTTKGVSKVCPAHKTSMRVIRVPITYGMLAVSRSDPPREVRSREFPFALDYFPGGCVVGDYTEIRIYLCPDCQKAEKHWRKTHSK